MKPTPEPVAFYATPPHRCSYLPEREAITVFADPRHRDPGALYSRLSGLGFRRSGTHVYVPACQGCRACVSVRIPVNDFEPRRRQRRIWARHDDVRVRAHDPVFNEAHFQLYRRYVGTRHPGGGMNDLSREEYLEFLTSGWSDTVFYEFRKRTELVAVAVTDHLSDGLSAVYTFFDPHRPRDGLGVYAILWQIEHARRLGLTWHYLGYWIQASEKMRYKAEFLPQQRLIDGHWTVVGGAGE